ncbi:MAG: TetR/AcrR family transcriptional regulator [Pseudomonadota bacterium]
MPRPRQFDEQDVLLKAMTTFWKHGYEATTFKMLEEATGVGVRGLSNVFGDKEQLFQRSLEAYHAMAETMISTAFATPSVDAIISFFEGLTAATTGADEIRNAGCLMVNTIFELGKTDSSFGPTIEAYRNMVLGHFEKALIASEVDDAPARAEFLLGVLWGALSQIRLAGSTNVAAPTIDVAVCTIRMWSTND